MQLKQMFKHIQESQCHQFTNNYFLLILQWYYWSIWYMITVFCVINEYSSCKVLYYLLIMLICVDLCSLSNSLLVSIYFPLLISLLKMIYFFLSIYIRFVFFFRDFLICQSPLQQSNSEALLLWGVFHSNFRAGSNVLGTNIQESYITELNSS